MGGGRLWERVGRAVVGERDALRRSGRRRRVRHGHGEGVRWGGMRDGRCPHNCMQRRLLLHFNTLHTRLRGDVGSQRVAEAARGAAVGLDKRASGACPHLYDGDGGGDSVVGARATTMTHVDKLMAPVGTSVEPLKDATITGYL